MPPPSPVVAKARYPITGHFDMGPAYATTRPGGIDDWLLIYTVAGGGLFSFEQERFAVGPHEAVLLRPGSAHGYGTDPAIERWQLLWAHFVPPRHWMDRLTWPDALPGMRRLTVHDPAVGRRVIEKLSETHQLARTFAHHRESLAMNALEAAVLWLDEQNPATRQAQLDPRIRKAVELICERFDQPLTLAQMARHAGLSPSRFSHLFRQQLGQSPQRFLESQRITRARQLLERTSLAVAEVAEAVGYESAFYFTRRFRLAVGASPRDYRQHAVGR